jgi:hypothetical protein
VSTFTDAFSRIVAAASPVDDSKALIAHMQEDNRP